MTNSSRHTCERVPPILAGAIGLIILWAIYLASRLATGTILVSDELFFINADFRYEPKRQLFGYLVQLMRSEYAALLIVSSLNIGAVIAAYGMLSAINRSAAMTFFQLLYCSAVAAYLFRDSVILLLFVSCSFLILRYGNLLLEKQAGRPSVASLLCVIALLVLMLDFRPHYTIFILIAWSAAAIALRFRSTSSLLTFGFSAILLTGVLAGWAAGKLYVYGIPLTEYIETREDRWGTTLTPVSFLASVVRHLLAPIPTSLVSRLALEGGSSVFGALDDFYRLVYRIFVYGCYAYILLSIRWIGYVFEKNRAEIVFFGTFCALNIATYSVFSFGGGHERVKLFSTFIFVLFAALIWEARRTKRKAYPSPHVHERPSNDTGP